MEEQLLPPPPKKGEAEVLLPPPPPLKKKSTPPQTPLVVSPTSLPQEQQGGLGGSVGSVLAQTLPTDNKPFSPEVGAGLAQGVKAFEAAQGVTQAQVNQPEVNKEQYSFTPEGIAKLGADIVTSDKVANSFNNFGLMMEGFEPRLNMAAASVWKNILGEELANNLLYTPEGRDVTIEQQLAADRLKDIEARMKEVGSITKGVKEGDAKELAAGVLDAGTSMLYSIIIGAPTGGATLATDQLGQFLDDYNKNKAESLGMKPSDIYAEGKESFAVPALLGTAAAGLELVGMKGVMKAITNKVQNAAMREAGLVLMASGGEATTEWVQTGLQVFNDELGGGATAKDATEKAVDAMFSQEGLESALKGAAGSGSIIIAGKAVRKITDSFSKGEKPKTEDIAQAVEAEIENGATSTMLDAAVINGDITEQQAEEVRMQMDEMAAIYETLPPEAQRNAVVIAPLIMERQQVYDSIEGLQEQMNSVDEAFAPKFKEQIDAATERVKSINAEILNLSTPQTDVELRSEEAVADIAAGEEAVGEVPSVVGETEGEVIGTDTGTDVEVATTEQPVKELKTRTIKQVMKEDGDAAAAIAKQYLDTDSFDADSGLDFKEAAIREYLWKVDEDSFTNLGDRNSLKDAPFMRNAWIANKKKGEKGQQIDSLAQEISERYGKEVTSEDIIKYMNDNKSGHPRRLPKQVALSEKYRELTGKNLDRSMAKKILAMYGNATPKQQAAPEMVDFTAKIVEQFTNENDDTEVDYVKLRDFLEEDPTVFSNFPFEIAEEDIDQFKNFVYERASDAKREAREVTELFAESNESEGGVREVESRPQLTAEDRTRNLAEVTELGRDNVPQALASIAKRTGTKYDKWDDVPQDVKESVSTERNKEKQDAIQEQSTAEVSIQPKAEDSGKVAEGTPKAEPKSVAEEGEAEIVIEAPQPVKGTPNEQQKTYNSAIQYFRSVADGDPKDVRKMITDYIKANRKYLNETANAKALRLVNLAKTEEKVLDALEYLDKLVNNAKFAKQVELADKEFTKGKRRMAGLLNMAVPLSKIRTIDAGDIRDGELLEKAAAMLANPTANSVQAMNELANEIVAHVEQNAKARAAKAKEKLRSYDSISDALDTLFTEELKDEQGNKITADKKIETVRQLSYYAGRIRRIEEAIAELSAAEDMLSPAQLTALENKADLAIERLEAYANGIKDKTTAKLSENLKVIREAANTMLKDESPTAFSQQIKNRLIDPLLDIKDDIGIYASEKLLRDVEDMMSGYIPRDMFKAIDRATNKQSVQAAKTIADNTSTATRKDLNDISKQGGVKQWARNLFRGTSIYGSDRARITDKMRTRRLSDIDAMSNLEQDGTYNKNFVGKWVSAVATFNKQSNIIKQKFFTGIGNPLRLNTIRPKVYESNIKVGAYLAQQQEQTQHNNSRGNVLAEAIRTAELSRFDIYHKRMLAVYKKLNKQYPQGVQFSDLTEAEKRKVQAFREGLDKTMPYQEASNAMRSEAFNALPDYFPLLYIANVGSRESTAAIEDNSRAVTNELLSYNGRPNKNAKLRSDRGLNRNPNAELGFINLDIESVFSQSIDQVLKEYYLYPVVFSANTALMTAEQQLPDGQKAIPQSLRTVFNERVSATFFHGSSIGIKLARNTIKGSVGFVLGTVERIVPEVVSNSLFLAPAAAKRGVSKADLKIATDIILNGKVIQKLDEDNAIGAGLTERLEDKLSKSKDVIERIADVIFSPDSVSQLGVRPTLFAMVFTDEFKKATGENFSAKAYMDDAGYADKYRGAIKDAYNVATSEAEKMYPMAGRSDRPTKIMRTKLLPEYGKEEFSSFAYEMIMTLSGFAQRAGITTDRAVRDVLSGANYGRTIGAITAATAIVSTASYAYLLDMVAALPDKWFGDDEEKEDAEQILQEMYSVDYFKLQMLSALMYLKFTRYGSVGRAMLIGGGVAAKDGYSNYLQAQEINLAEYDLAIKDFEKMFSDATYRELKPTYKLAWQDMLVTLLGGAELVGKNMDSNVRSMANAWEAAANGDEEAINSLYALGMMYNLLMPTFTGARPIPYFKSFKSLLDDKQLSDPELMTTEQFVKMRRSESRRNGSALRMMADDYVKAKKAGDTEKMQGIDRVAEDLIFNSERKVVDANRMWKSYQKTIEMGETPIKYKKFMDETGEARAFAIAKEVKALQKKNDFQAADKLLQDVEAYNMLTSSGWAAYQEYVSQ